MHGLPARSAALCKLPACNTVHFPTPHCSSDHFKRDHYLCPHPACLEKKFVVFQGEQELKTHTAR
jgi:hypothetical protein